MPDVMHFWGGSGKGTYFFRAEVGWVVADLDLGTSALHDRLAVVTVDDYSGAKNWIGSHLRMVLGQKDAPDGRTQYLIRVDDAVLLLRDYPDDVEADAVYEADGTVSPYPDKVLRALGAFAAGWRRKHGRDGG